MLKMEGRGNNVGMLKVTECELEGLKIIEPQVFADDRGTIETLAECLKESGAGEIYFVTLCIGQL